MRFRRPKKPSLIRKPASSPTNQGPITQEEFERLLAKYPVSSQPSSTQTNSDFWDVSSTQPPTQPPTQQSKVTLMTILRDPVWQLIGIIVGIIIAGLTFWYQQSRKEMSYQIVSLNPLFSVSDEARGNIQVSFNGKPVDNAYFAVIRINNSGNIPILKDDYDNPVNIIFNPNVEIISAQAQPNFDSAVNVKLSQNSITLDPILMNPGDSIDIKILINKYDNGITLNSRIIGVNKLRLIANNSISNIFKEPIFYALAIILGIFANILSSYILSSFLNNRLGPRISRTLRRILRSLGIDTF